MASEYYTKAQIDEQATILGARIKANAGANATAVIGMAEGLDIIAADAAKAAAGNPAATTTFISMPPRTEFSPNSYNTSLEDYNNFYVNDVFVGAYNLGENFEYDAVQGDKITSDKGHSGVYNIDGGTERPIELASAALADREFFWYAFRSPNHRHVTQALALESLVKVYGPDPVFDAEGKVTGDPIQEVTVAAFDFLDFTTDTDGEYYLIATQPVVLSTTNFNLAYDQRVIAPLSNKIFGHTAGAISGDARISARYANTNITVYTQDGTIYTGVASPGAPLSLNGYDDGLALGIDKNYLAPGWLIIVADGPIAGFAGADSQGTNATTFQSTSSASQRIGLPLAIISGNAGDNVAGCSEYAGTVWIYQNDGTLITTRQIERSGTIPNPATDAAHQLHPAAFWYGSTDSDFVALNRGAYLKANVPINVVANFNEGNAGRADDDETACFGITNIFDKAEISTNSDGFKRRREIDDLGLQTWEAA